MKKILAIMAAPFVWVTTPVHAQNEAAVIAATRQIGTAWQTISTTRAAITVRCEAGGYKSLRLQPGSSISFDLRKTESLMNPLVGIVTIQGAFESNESRPDGQCSASIAAARQNEAYAGNDRVYQMQINYQVQGDTMIISGGNEVFMNQAGRQLLLMVPGGVPPVWLNAISAKIK